MRTKSLKFSKGFRIAFANRSQNPRRFQRNVVQDVRVDAALDQRADERVCELGGVLNSILPISSVDRTDDEPGEVARDAVASRSSVEISEVGFDAGEI